MAGAVSIGAVRAQQGTPLTQEQKDQRVQNEKELESVAVIERKVMIPMRDGVAWRRMSTDRKMRRGRCRLFGCARRTILIFGMCATDCLRTRTVLTAVKRGYAYVVQNERGHSFSKGITRF